MKFAPGLFHTLKKQHSIKHSQHILASKAHHALDDQILKFRKHSARVLEKIQKNGTFGVFTIENFVWYKVIGLVDIFCRIIYFGVLPDEPAIGKDQQENADPK